jgi:sialic acid synthase
MFEKRSFGGGVYIIAEVGQNHNGDFEMARQYVRAFAASGANAIKFQTRNNKYLFSGEAYDAPYSSENAYGKTYGEHRDFLELTQESLALLKKDCHDHGVDFISTPFDEPSVDLLFDLDVDAYKVASFDLGNLPFLDYIGKKNKPIILSTGGGDDDSIAESVKILSLHHNDLAILHCVSEYPCAYDRLGLSRIRTLCQNFKDYVIGLSDHFNGTLSGPIAYLQGARVFEKHVTLNRALKGTDHSFALEPEGFRRFVRDIKRAGEMLPPKPTDELGKEPVFSKLGKSVVARERIDMGQIISLTNLTGKILSREIIPVRQSSKIIGRVARVDIPEGKPIQYSDLC